MEATNVFNPSHYGGKDDPYETIKVLEAWLTPDEMIGFCKGNAIKYQTRHRQKGGLEDLSKAAWYQNHLVKYLTKRGLSAHGPFSVPPEKSDPSRDKQVAALAAGEGAPSAPAGAPAADELDAGIAAIAASFTPAQEKTS